MNTTAIIVLSATLALLLVTDLALGLLVISRMVGRREHHTPSRGWDRAWIRGWKYEDLRPLMILWTLAGLATAAVSCATLGAILL